jgi:hypothetical protein
MELPMWLAAELHLGRLVDVQVPTAFGLKARAELRASARTVRLRDWSPAFYEVGLRLGRIATGDDAQKLTEDVHHALADRIGVILDAADGGYRHDMSAFKESLTDLELTLYTGALAAHAERVAKKRPGGRRGGMLLPGAAGAVALASGSASAVGPGGLVGNVAVTTTTTAEVVAAASYPKSKAQKRGRTALT